MLRRFFQDYKQLEHKAVEWMKSGLRLRLIRLSWTRYNVIAINGAKGSRPQARSIEGRRDARHSIKAHHTLHAFSATIGCLAWQFHAF